MKEIVCFKLKTKSIEVINDYCKVKSEYSVKEYNDFSLLMAHSRSHVNSLYIYVDESFSVEILEKVLKHFDSYSVNVIFKEKNFDLLLLCHRWQVNHIFEEKISKESFNASMIKTELLEKNTKDLPVSQIVKLFSSPVKIKTNEEFLERMRDYLQFFNEVKGISVLESSESESKVLGDPVENVYEKFLKQVELPRKFIGFEKIFEKDNHCVLATPVFEENDTVSWLIVELERNGKSYIFNDLFFKYLENVLIYRANKNKEKNLTALANTDEVTGLFNQRKLSEDLSDAIELHEKLHKNFSLMFIDIDHFKSVNDNFGHVIGSKLLLDIGNELRLILRQSDHIYRYGGDEFVVIMPNVSIKIVHEVALRVLDKIKSTDFDIGDGKIHKLSISIGIAEYPTDASSAVEIIKFADEMMYMSKRSGRGKVFHVKEVDNVNVSAE